MSTFEIRRTAAAPPETVFDVFTDHRRYADLVTAIRSSTLEQEGDPAPNGVGAVRALRLPGVTVREQVTDFHRPGRYAYRMRSGVPLRHYTATVTFTPAGEGRTEVVYTVDVEPKLRALEPLLDKIVRKSIADFTDAAVARAERPQG
ncbi:SRPBCC family protein [Streptomyces sp. NPDC048710]|uniref:SRPBCC family protein n=1 Tax=unclassified Streptomyces TaxID=2593676 RepID=UPI0037236576